MYTALPFSSLSSLMVEFLGVFMDFAFSSSNLFRRSLMNSDWLIKNYFGLIYLKSKEEIQFSHHAHFKFTINTLRKIFTNTFISSTKNNIININLYYNNVFTLLFDKKFCVHFSHRKTI